MEFGVLGAGEVALAIARQLLAAGHEVAVSSRRGPSALREKVIALGPGARAAAIREAAAARVVVLAVPWSEVQHALADLPPWNGRILIDATNPFVPGAAGYEMADLGDRSSSVTVAGHAPGARVVKAFNSILMSNLQSGATAGGGRRVLFVSGDDAMAKAEVCELVEEFGFAAIDLGTLEEGGRMQQGGGPLAGKDLVMLTDWSLSG